LNLVNDIQASKTTKGCAKVVKIHTAACEESCGEVEYLGGGKDPGLTAVSTPVTGSCLEAPLTSCITKASLFPLKANECRSFKIKIVKLLIR